jgi:hypothetical protein
MIVLLSAKKNIFKQKIFLNNFSGGVVIKYFALDFIWLHFILEERNNLILSDGNFYHIKTCF